VYRQAVVMKCIQVGVSALTARIALYAADVEGLNAMYVFPTKSDVHDFSDDRIDGMIIRSEYLRGRLGETVNKSLTQIGGGNVYWRGSNSKSGLQSAAIDVLVLDEYDDLTPKHIPEAERRIAGSLNARIRRVGVPSYPDYGLHNFWEKSDKRLWLLRCENEQCKFIGKDFEGQALKHPRGYGWQVLNFFENID
jgi:phage terminase large subunit GpA-like protein